MAGLLSPLLVLAALLPAAGLHAAPRTAGALRTPAAQDTAIHGVLVDAATGRPIVGARVILVAGDGRRLLATLTGVEGSFRLPAPPPGRYTLRAERVGYAAESQTIETAADGSARVQMAVRVRTVMLEGLAATARPRCGMRADDGGTPANVLWEEARKALDATAWAQEEGLFSFQVRRHRNTLEPRTLRVESEDTTRLVMAGARPFESIPAGRLDREGYVRADGGEFVYYAPDAAVLLSREFLDGHCFRAVRGRGERAGLAGLAFEPVPGRRLPDVRGTLWLDRRTAELKELEYRYTHLPSDLAGGDGVVGGQVAFERLPTGAWIVRSWYIRMPVLVRQVYSVGSQRGHVDRLAAIREEGGVVTGISSPLAGVVRGAGRTGGIEGVVFDSSRAAPLPGARVFVPGWPYETTTDARGRFRLEAVPAGHYRVSFAHPRLDSLRYLPAPVPVEVGTDGPTAAALAIPGISALRAEACGSRAGEGAILVGQVVADGTGQPLPGAEVRASWHGQGRPGGSATARTDETGGYVLCGLPASVPVSVSATVQGVRGTREPVMLDAGAPWFATVAVGTEPRRQGTVTASSRDADSTRVAGTVLAAASGEPVSGAVVRLVRQDGPSAASVERTTDARGRFRVSRIVPGRYRLEVEHPSLASAPQTVVVTDGVRLDLELRIPARGTASPSGP
jgi:hypothetical protein